MSKWRDTFFRQATGKTYKASRRRRTAKQTIEDILQRESSDRDPCFIGWAASDNRHINLYDEDRKGHIHILGAPDEGKSRLLQLLGQHHIDHNYGFTLI